LSFSKNDTLRLLEQHESGWWKGEKEGKTGVFPRNFVVVIEQKDKAVALHDFSSVDPKFINFNKGEALTVLMKDVSGWWTVTNASNQTGLAPRNYLKIVETEETKVKTGEVDEVILPKKDERRKEDSLKADEIKKIEEERKEDSKARTSSGSIETRKAGERRGSSRSGRGGSAATPAEGLGDAVKEKIEKERKDADEFAMKLVQLKAAWNQQKAECLSGLEKKKEILLQVLEVKTDAMRNVLALMDTMEFLEDGED